MEQEKILWWARIASLVGGVLILVGTVVAGFVSNYAFWYTPPGTPVAATGPGAILLMIGGASGVVVLVSSTQLERVEPGRVPTWGVAVLIAGLASFVATGGFIIGGLSAVTAGVLVLLVAQPGTRAAA